MTTGFRRWIVLAGCALGALIGGCGSDVTGSAGSSVTGSVVRNATGGTLSISGVPARYTTAGYLYSFQPQTAGIAATPRFSISNKPAWATFNASSGNLSGTPTTAGMWAGITISVSDGVNSAALAPFSITVSPATATRAISLSWMPPTQNTDGTPLADLKGYRLLYGAVSGLYTNSIDVSNPGLTSYVVQNLEMGTYYFAIAAYNSAGRLSSLSGEVRALVN